MENMRIALQILGINKDFLNRNTNVHEIKPRTDK
jgi:hypothetical protein